MTIHHLDCATMCPRGGRALLGGDHLVGHCLLVEGPEGLVLVDTGFGTADVADPKRLGPGLTVMSRPRLSLARTALHQVRALGHDPRDVRDIVLTHLDPDHAGGLSDFPWARVHVFGEELAAAVVPRNRNERQRYRTAQWAHGPKWVAHEPDGEHWYGFAATRVLDAPEVLLVPLPGHTRGHSAVAVRSGDSWLLHCGDAYFHHGEADPAVGRAPLGLALFQRALAVDDAARRHNQERLRALRREHEREVTLFCAHDPAELARLAR
ncbi:MBL fold metallo-hydrolase [Kitasatospora sp. MMS16-BH015]|uniref:MBL fold metallo-hydrolase n=1 Tax=Kitasatospora sp. MMS16-BH015 TaxID=2018025 RepID=UPI000CA3F0BA|nr:MBL fold metallo-hydrolase [Kitasatospora sp. MMS16-BH015]AUG77157.1 MBL fold metallo-hydrolase [Kitasatospora sp. MMS16-BH015]